MSYKVIEKQVMSSDGVNTLCGKVYVPDGEIKGLFQIVHGMSEHIGRYDCFMGFLADNGFVAFGHDHVGHGKTAMRCGSFGYIAEKDGYKVLVDDVGVFARAVIEDFPIKKHVLMGHSMGSFIARLYAAKHGKELAGLVIMGTSGPNPAAKIGIAVTGLMKRIYGARHISHLVHFLSMGSYNNRTDKKTEFDWLSVNEDNVKRYIDDDLCGFHFTVSAMQDLMNLIAQSNSRKWAGRIPRELPVYIVSGGDDPVGGYGKGVKKVCAMLEKAGVADVEMKLYQGFRHEILNEDIFNQVCFDVLEFSQNRLF
jgi:alpha-beta hydrolase superfamily lysophospholipase